MDFGSTFTKIAAFDLEKEELLARVQAPSTADTDITSGLFEALEMLSETVPVSDSDIGQAVACSSAAGGLKMICIGLCPNIPPRRDEWPLWEPEQRLSEPIPMSCPRGRLRKLKKPARISFF